MMSRNATDNLAPVIVEHDVAQQGHPEEAHYGQRLTELKEMLDAYNEVTNRLHASHETLTGEVQRLRSELATANAALQRSKRLAALGEMAAGIAHEIRNPLGSISLYTGMLVEDLKDQPELLEQARKILTCVRGANGIVNDVLSFANEIKVRATLVEVEQLVIRALDTLKPVISTTGVEVQLDVESGLEIQCDIELMNQVLTNLMQNALQAMGDDGVLGIEARAEDGQCVIVISDTGPGIKEADIDRIFNPFFTTRHTGTGLGLAIVHRIIDAHGGTITVHNDSQQGGAVFTVLMPGQPDERSSS